MKKLSVSLIVLLGLLYGTTARGKAVTDEEISAPKLNESIIDVLTDDKLLHLQVTVYKPQGKGPFPMAVLNHGKDKGDPHLEPRYRSVYLARYFVSRGYMVVLPMLRGFAGSGGTFNAMHCDAEHEGIAQARDIRTVIEYMSRQPDVDGKRIVVAGQSYGGWNTLAVGTLDVPGVRGLINFAGGRNEPLCSTWESNLAISAGHYGHLTKVPSIWFYGDNDSKFSRNTWHSMYDDYTNAGGKVELVAYGDFLKDSHNFLGSVEALPMWVPKMDAFLGRLGLPNQNLAPELLPVDYPPPTHFAAIDDINAVPGLNGLLPRNWSRWYESLRSPRGRKETIT